MPAGWSAPIGYYGVEGVIPLEPAEGRAVEPAELADYPRLSLPMEGYH